MNRFVLWADWVIYSKLSSHCQFDIHGTYIFLNPKTAFTGGNVVWKVFCPDKSRDWN